MYFRGKACSKNNSLLERVDSRVQHIWRLGVMGSCTVDFSQFLEFYSQEDRYLLRHFDTKSLKKKYARTNILKNSYFYRIVDEWNSLPLEVRSACTVD